MRQYRTVLTALVLTALLLAGCASDDGGGQPPAAAPTPTPTVPVTTAPAGKPAGKVERVTGRVEAGVEAGCKLLVADSGGGYLLLGGPADVLKEGARVEVEGTVEPGLMTTCQQGRP